MAPENPVEVGDAASVWNLRRPLVEAVNVHRIAAHCRPESEEASGAAKPYHRSCSPAPPGPK